MSESPSTERDAWNHVKDIIGTRSVTLGGHWSFNIRNDPKRLPFVLSRYKFAAKMVRGGEGQSEGTEGRRDEGTKGSDQSAIRHPPSAANPQSEIRNPKSEIVSAPPPGFDLLELGCSEGIGTPILAEFARSYTGVDLDADAVAAAQRNFAAANRTFIADDFLGKTYGRFDAVVSLDVCEHIVPELEHKYFDTIAANITDTGVAVVGTPNKTADQYASAMSKAGHVNLFDAAHLMRAMRRIFHNVFPFGINDEVVHTGYAPMCHYLVCVGCNKREQAI